MVIGWPRLTWLRPDPCLVDPEALPPRALGIFTPSNGSAVWDLGHSLNDPTGELKSYTQMEGPLDVFLSWGKSGVEVKRDWRSLLKGDGGQATLAGRSWLGYIASTMGQAESVRALLWSLSTGPNRD